MVLEQNPADVALYALAYKRIDWEAVRPIVGKMGENMSVRLLSVWQGRESSPSFIHSGKIRCAGST